MALENRHYGPDIIGGNIDRLFSSSTETFQPTEKNDLRTLGINPDVVKSVDRRKFWGAEVPSNYFIELGNGEYRLRGNANLEINVQTGDGYRWAGRVSFFPQDATKNGELVALPSFMMEDGYEILIHDDSQDTNEESLAQEDAPILTRIDSICKTSFNDGGHFSSAGREDLGCDCWGQRQEAKRLIMKRHRGISILSPMEGRGNGKRVHAQQIQIQNYMARTGQEIPDTYKTVEALGHKRDSRPEFYFIEALIIKELLGLENIELLSNNPDKADSLKQAGIKVILSDLIDAANPDYYKGVNANAKRANGHTGLGPDRIATIFERRKPSE